MAAAVSDGIRVLSSPNPGKKVSTHSPLPPFRFEEPPGTAEVSGPGGAERGRPQLLPESPLILMSRIIVQISVHRIFGRDKSVALDLKTEIGSRVLHELLRIADALVENFRPASLARIGLGFADVHRTSGRSRSVSSLARLRQSANGRRSRRHPRADQRSRRGLRVRHRRIAGDAHDGA
jgi:hypothetical protein